MAIVCRIYGAANKTQWDLNELSGRLRLLLESEVKEHEKLSGRKTPSPSVHIFFPTDLCEFGVGRGIAVFIDGFPFNDLVCADTVEHITRNVSQLMKYYFPVGGSVCIINGYQVAPQDLSKK